MSDFKPELVAKAAALGIDLDHTPDPEPQSPNPRPVRRIGDRVSFPNEKLRAKFLADETKQGKDWLRWKDMKKNQATARSRGRRVSTKKT